MASHSSWDAKVSFWNGGNPPPCSEGGVASVPVERVPVEWFSAMAGLRSAVRASSLESEQQQERDQQREDAERLGDGEAEDQVGELALSGRRIAQCGGQIVAEDGAAADAGATHADARNA